MKQGSNNSFRRFFALWLGQLVSTIGSGLTSFGLGVYVYQQTGQVVATTLVMLCAFLPSIALSAPAGVLADRYDRRLLMILGDGLSALGLIFIVLCMLNGKAELWQIYTGVVISSVFASLMEPAYKATVTDMLSKDQYARASGMVQLAGSSKYLISPLLAGLLLSAFNIQLLLIIDICTIVLTVVVTAYIRKGLSVRPQQMRRLFIVDFIVGWKAIRQRRGVLTLVMLSSLLTFFVGFIQTLSTPMILSFSNEKVLGMIVTIGATGMLIASLFLSIFPIKRHFHAVLSVALCLAGLALIGFGLRESIPTIVAACFLFFATLPFVNTSLDYLVRSNISNQHQGKAWGLISLISQFGAVMAFAFSGLLADFVFKPLLLSNGALKGTIGTIIGVGEGRGIALLIIVAGLSLVVTAGIISVMYSIKKLEQWEGAREP